MNSLSSRVHIRYATFAFLLVLMSGCSGGSGEKQPSDQSGLSRVEQSAATCFKSGCHETQTSASGSGRTIAAEWQASPHRQAAACLDCHKMTTGHPNSCDECHGGANPNDSWWRNGKTPPDVLLTDNSSKTVCIDCHGDTASMWQADQKHPERGNSRSRHFPVSGAVVDSSYTASEHGAGGTLTGNCRECHNPHDVTNSAEHRNWISATSLDGPTGVVTKGHAKQDSLSWANPNIAYQLRSDCVRCHTTTGFSNYVESSFTNESTFSTDKPKLRQTLYCNACHNNASGRAYGFNVRNVPAVLGKYSFGGDSSTYQFSNLGRSNVCVPCHAGLIRGESLKTLAPALAVVFPTHPNPGSAAALLQQVPGIGYQYDQAGSYGVPHGHTGKESQFDQQRGPCLSCHTSNHTFRVFSYSANGIITGINSSSVCKNCHIGNALPMSPADAENYRKGYNAALAALKKELLLKDPAGTLHINNAGAWFNYKLLSADPGGYAHNPTYVKILIYDSIDWIDDGVINRSVATTIGSTTDAGNYLLKNGSRPF